MYTVKEASEKLGITEHTIRYYTDKGLVPMLTRDKNNNRLFDEGAIGCLLTIKCLRETGMSLAAIKTYIMLSTQGDSTVNARFQIIQEQQKIASTQLEEAKHRLAFLNTKAEIYRNILENGAPDNMNLLK